MDPHRTPPSELGPRAPYWNSMENCPLGCGGNWGFLYQHRPDCEWQKAYEVAGERMAEPEGTAGVQGGRYAMTEAEISAIRALRPPPPRAPSWWARFKALFA